MIIKICGVTNLDDARAACDAGATAIGLNFFPRSPRYIDPETAAPIAAAIPRGVLKVGVFVNEAPADLAAQLGLDIIQVHGQAPAPDYRYWQAVSVRPDFAPAELDAYSAEAFLLDAPAGDQYGGTGRTFDWAGIGSLTQKVIIAGGLDETNVARAIELAQPWGVDACSRLERTPGLKDHRKMAAFIAAALNATCQHLK